MSSNALTWALGLDASGFHKELNAARRAVQQGFKGAFGDLMAPIAKVTAAVGSVAGVMQGIKGGLDLGSEMKDLSARTGIAVGDLYMLRKIFKDTGVDASKLGPAINTMQKALASAASGGQEGNVLKAMGLDPQTLASMDSGKAFEAIGARIAQLPNSVERASAAMQIFGKSGGELLQVFMDPAFAEAGNLSNTAKILGQNAASFAEASSALGHVGGKLQGFFVGMNSQFVPLLHNAIQEFEKMDLSGIGSELGAVIGNFTTDWRQQAKVMTDLTLALIKLAFSPTLLKPLGLELLSLAAGFGTEIRRVMLQAKQGSLIEKVGTAFQATVMTVKELYDAPDEEQLRLQKQADEINSKNPNAQPVTVFELKYQENKKLIREGYLGDLDEQGRAAQALIAQKLKKDAADLNAEIAKILAQYPAFTPPAKTKEALEKGRSEADKEGSKTGSKTGPNAEFDPSAIGQSHGQIIADSFAKVGGGGYSVFLGLGDVQRQQLAAHQQTNQLVQQLVTRIVGAPPVGHAHASP